MATPRPLPWPGITLAIVTSAAIYLAGAGFWLALAVLILWLGSLWLVAVGDGQVARAPAEAPLDTDRMADLIEFAGNPLILVDRNRIAIANRAARKALGSHIVGQDVRVALRHPDALKLIDKRRTGSALVRGMSRRRDIWRISRQQLDENLAVIELINRTAEEDIGRAHTDFVANASHELRTPLASIIGYVETLQDLGQDAGQDARQDGDERVDDATSQKFHRTILREARRLQQLVSDLMSLSRIEAEKHDLPAERIDLAEVAGRAARDAAGPERVQRLAFEFSFNPIIRGDTQQIEQLVRNLVDNALKYGASDGKVTISLRPTEGRQRACLAVADQGEGIPAEQIPHLTRRFYRTDPGRSRASGGTGLGLAIVKHIVERHRAKLDISSKAGEGTIIAVRFPVLDADGMEEG